MFFEGSKPTMNISDVTSSCMTSTGVPCVQKRFEEGHVSSLVKAPKKLVLSPLHLQEVGLHLTLHIHFEVGPLLLL